MYKKNPVSVIKSNEIKLCNWHNSNECHLENRRQIKIISYIKPLLYLKGKLNILQDQHVKHLKTGGMVTTIIKK